jgi:hypothetical protein
MATQLAWAWYAADSPAKTSASPEREGGSPRRGRASGGNSGGSSASSARVWSSSRTFTEAGSGGCPSCGAPSGRSGMPACRFECPPPKLGLPTVARDVFFLPTPMASQGGYNQGGASPGGPIRYSLGGLARRGLLPTCVASPNANRSQPEHKSSSTRHGGYLSSRVIEAHRGLLPTPMGSAGTRGGRHIDAASREGGPSLAALAHRGLLATPTLHGNYNRTGASENSGDGLATQMGGRLNPQFLEWMMGLPTDWTASGSVETEPFPSK